MVPLHKIGAGVQDVKFANMAQMDQAYFNCTLGHLVESMEVLLDEGLGLASGGPQQFAIELDLEGLLRMDPLARAERNERAMSAGWMSPDEARATEGLPRLPHGLGAVPWVQMQDHPMTMAAQDVVMRDVNRRLAEVERELTQ